MGEVRILIADDDRIIREGLAELLDHQEGISVVAVAKNGDEALAVLANKPIDVALIDVDMPVLDGIKAAGIIGETYPQVAVVMLTAFEHEESLAQSLAQNVRGFLTKDIPPDQLAELIKQAHSGMSVMSPRPSRILAETYVNAHVDDAKYAEFRAKVEELPDYLRPVFDQVITGRPNKLIAKELHLTEPTVRSYISDIFAATGFTNRSELAITAIKAGY